MAAVRANCASAVAASRARYAALKAALKAEHVAQVAQVTAAEAAKLRALSAVVAHATSAVTDLGTAICSAEAALAAGAAPAVVLHVRNSVLRVVRVARDRSPRVVDTTLQLAPDGRARVFPLGSVVTVAVDAAGSTLVAPGFWLP
jgi:hypothetical protein